MDPYCALWCVFLWELPQMRFTEKQLNKRLASHELTSVARECSAGQTSVQLLLCPTSCGCSQKKTSHSAQYGVLRSTIFAHNHARSRTSSLAHSWTSSRGQRPTHARGQRPTLADGVSQTASHSFEKNVSFLSVPVAQLVKAYVKGCFVFSKVLEFKPRSSQITFKVN